MFEKALEIQPGHRATLAGAHRPLHRRGRLGGGDQAEARAAGLASTRTRREVHALRGDRRHLQGQAEQPAEGDRRPPRGAQLQAERSPAAAQPARSLQRDQAVEEGDGDPRPSWPSSRPARSRPRYLVAAGNIANYELHSTDEAVEIYNQALDEDPDDLKAFERIDKIMTAKKDWRNQERNYRQDDQAPRPGAAGRASKPTQVALWHALGEIYRSRLKDYKSATAAFEVCVQLDPGRDAAPPDPGRALSAVGPRVLRQGGQGVPPPGQGRRRTSARWPST